mgnify:CR=1 FL=1
MFQSLVRSINHHFGSLNHHVGCFNHHFGGFHHLDVCKEKENDACLQYLLQHLLKHLLDLQFLQYLAFVCTELHSAWTCLRMVCDVSHFQQCFPRKWKLDCERVGAEDIVLCNGVTMYFPSANYLLKCSWNFKPNFFLFLGVLCFGFLCVRFVVKTWCS